MQYCAGTTPNFGRNKKNKAWVDNFIVEIKKKLKKRSKTESKIYLICNDIHMYSKGVVLTLILQK